MTELSHYKCDIQHLTVSRSAFIQHDGGSLYNHQ